MKSVFLTGIKHSGKSTLAKQLARMLRVPYIDVDEVISNQCGMTPRELFLARGEDAFKEAELKACRSACARAKDGGAVVAAGGGLCDNPLAVDCVRGAGLVIYLDVPEAVAFKRIFSKAVLAKDGSLQNLPVYIASGNPHSEAEAAELFHPVFVRRAERYLLFAHASFEPRDAPSEQNAKLLALLIERLNDCT